MEKKTITIFAVVIVIAIVAVGALLFFTGFKGDDADKFIGNWIAESGMLMPADVTAYFTFYDNGTVERTLVYPTFKENSYWMNYWFEGDLIYITGNYSYITRGYNYEFSNGDTRFKLIRGSDTPVIFNKISTPASNLWIKTFDGFFYPDEAYSVTTDSEGDVYVVGCISNVSGDPRYDWWIKKFDSKGNEDIINWNKIIGKREKSEQAISVATDSFRNVYVVGSGYDLCFESDGSNGSANDWWLKKFDSNGNEDLVNWNKTYDYNKTFDKAFSVAVDGDDNVYVLGYFWQPFADDQKSPGKPPILRIKKFDSNGNEDTINWNKTYYNGGFVGSISIDADNNVYVVWTGRDQNWSYYGAIKKFDKNGNQLWNKQYIDNESKIFTPISITADGNGNIYVSGIKISGYTNEGWWIKKFDSNGNEDILNWDISYEVEGSIDQPKSIVTDKDGYVYVAGFGTNLTGQNGKDWWIMKFDSYGNRIWEKTYDGNGNDDAIWAATVDNDGCLYVVGSGTHLGDTTYQDWWIKKLID